jgi:hypothetical protein
VVSAFPFWRCNDHQKYASRAILDAAHAVDVACSDVKSGVGLRVRAEFQEIQGGNLIIELQLGDEAGPTPHPAQLASVIDDAVSPIDVLSSWKESTSSDPTPLRCPNVFGMGYEPLPQVARRALHDDLPTAKWDRADSSWHLAVLSLCAGQGDCRNVVPVRVQPPILSTRCRRAQVRLGVVARRAAPHLHHHASPGASAAARARWRRL